MSERSTNDSKLLSIQELSSESGVSVPTLRRWKNAGRIPFHQPGGRGGKLYFPSDAIQRADSDAAASDVPDVAPMPQAGRKPAWMQ